MAKTVTFPHAVIYNGVLYPANAAIEVKEEKVVVEKNETTIEETAEEKPKKRGAKA